MNNLADIADGIVLGEDGVWYSRTRSNVSYPDDGNERCAQVEDRSFWFAHRNRCVVALLEAYPPAGAVFDIGGGNGYVARGLVAAGREAVLLEPGFAGARAAKARGLEDVVCATLEGALLKDQSISAAGLFDVIEHIDDDRDFLRRVHRILAPGGRLYLTTPAYDWLWSEDDVGAGHYRRHTLHSIGKLAESSGFTVDFASYFFRWLPLPIFLLRTLPTKLGFRPNASSARRAEREHVAGSAGIVRGLADRLLSPEVELIRRSKPMSFGASCLLAASRR